MARALRKQRSLKDHAAKDILRAANLALLGPEDPEVAADLTTGRFLITTGGARCAGLAAGCQVAPWSADYLIWASSQSPGVTS